MQSGQAQDNLLNVCYNGALMTGSEAAAITAKASGTQVTAIALPDGCNKLGTVTTTSDSVKLPPAIAGKVVYVANQGAQTAQVFGNGIDTINAVATATGVALATTKNAIFFCTRSAYAGDTLRVATAGEWYMVLSA